MDLKIKINFNKLGKWVIAHLKSLVLIFSTLIVVGFGTFLYYNFYQTIISAKEIIVLQSDVSPAQINTKLLDQIERSFTQKTTAPEYKWDQFSSLFQTSGSRQTNENIPAVNKNPTPQTNF